MNDMKKTVYVTIFIVCLLVSFLGITYSFEYNDKDSLIFELIGPAVLDIDVNTEYEEYGVKVYDNGKDISSFVNVDSTVINTKVLGEYKVKYSVIIDGNEEYVYRTVNVIDKTSPIIKLKGDSEVYVIRGGSFYDDGYEVIDNYDDDLLDKVIISGNVDTSKVGEYELEYKVVDSSGNEGVISRRIIVKNPEITLADMSGNIVTYNSYDVTKFSNTITKNNWTNTGIYYEGYMKDISNIYKIKLKNKDNSLEYLYNMSISNTNYYSGNLDLTLISNGEYSVYIIGNREERLLNKLGALTRIVRARVGNKLITISYNNDEVNIIVDDFKYEYDILIDPGHGGSDIGASNGIVYEKDMNLKQSLYEKCRYESMGYKVYLTRYDDSYGTLIGSNSIDQLQRRSFTVGYYGAVSRVTYSNHHNASEWSGDHGFEILVSNKLSKDDLVVETALYNRYKKYYKINDDWLRLYSRDYNTGKSFDKFGGNVYSYMDYYAVIRIPDELFNVKTIIFEPMYLSNYNDFNWYWNDKNWINTTEIKIEEYVNYLGGKYIEDNSMCL